MDIRSLDASLAVSPQLSPDDLAAVHEQGFRSIVCNRPDGESAEQPDFDAIARAAQALGMEARYIPVVAGAISDEDVAHFAAALEDLPGPVLAYCRTGNRSSMLWSRLSA